jgi:hypothetical protein
MALSCGALLAAEGEDAARMAANETAAAACCKAFAEAEEIFRRTDYGSLGCLRYAQTLHGGKNKKVELAPAEQAALPKATAEEQQKIETLIKNMGADEFAVREKAAADVAALGPKALPQLQNAAKTETDAEIVQRCKKISQDIAEKLAPQAAITDLNGLFSTADGDGDLCLIDKTFAEAECPLGADPAKITPKAGYLFRVLTKQGAAATGGKKSYVVSKNMTLGYALLAFPKEYGKTGRDCFLINSNGTIYQKGFGDKAKNEAFVKACDEFNPDATWVPAD